LVKREHSPDCNPGSKKIFEIIHLRSLKQAIAYPNRGIQFRVEADSVHGAFAQGDSDLRQGGS
jgi:hypothetical protein